MPPSYANVTHNIAHRHFGYSGNEVSWQFKSHTKGIPNFDVYLSNEPCKGCMQSKMPLQPFPPLSKRAIKAFELVHSDLKFFPVESYNCHKYVTIFFDDYTFNAWVVCMRQKSHAIKATWKFLALVKMQYNVKVQK